MAQPFEKAAHDPGGANHFPLLPGWEGAAQFAGENNEYRLTLLRFKWEARTSDYTASPYSLVIGMNPSTAEADVDDLTVRKDIGFTVRANLFTMVKGNVSPYRCTDPNGLTALGVRVSHPDNLPTIRRHAASASLILIATGAVPPILRPLASEMFKALKADGRVMHCLGLTKDGWPKHTSRLGYDTPLERFMP